MSFSFSKNISDIPNWAKTILSNKQLRPGTFKLEIGKIGQEKDELVKSTIEYELSKLPGMLPYWIPKTHAKIESLRKQQQNKPNGAIVHIHGGEGAELFIYYPGEGVTSYKAAYNDSALNSSDTEVDLMLGFKYILEPNEIIMEITSFMGKKFVRFYLHPDNFDAKQLMPSTQPTVYEKIVLASFGYKDSYAGESNVRFKEANRITSISLTNYNQAKESCMSKGWIKKAGRGTTRTAEGDNLVGTSSDLYNLKKELQQLNKE